MKSAVWISFDLGIKGDYEGLYRWLDEHLAVECGDNLGFVRIDHPKEDIVRFFTQELAKAVRLDERSRIYIIWKNTKGNVSGTWVVGGRRVPPWRGTHHQRLWRTILMPFNGSGAILS